MRDLRPPKYPPSRVEDQVVDSSQEEEKESPTKEDNGTPRYLIGREPALLLRLQIIGSLTESFTPQVKILLLSGLTPNPDKPEKRNSIIKERECLSVFARRKFPLPSRSLPNWLNSTLVLDS